MSERGMLSRLAESLYWIGRYLERTDDTARIVDSYVHRMVEDPFNDEDATCRSLYSILGIDVDSEEPVTTEQMLQHIVYDADNPNSIWIVGEGERAGVEQMLQNPDLGKVMQDAGVTAPPELWVA